MQGHPYRQMSWLVTEILTVVWQRYPVIYDQSALQPYLTENWLNCFACVPSLAGVHGYPLAQRSEVE